MPRRSRKPLPPGVRRAAKLFPAAFAAHVLEEAPGFTRWAQEHASERYSRADFARNNTVGLALTAGGTLLVLRSSSRSVFLVYYSVVLSQQALFNTAFHAGTTVAWRAYSPGLFTSLALFLPLWLGATRSGLREGLLTRPGLAAALAVAGLVHTVAVAQQVFFAGRAWRARP